MAVTTLHELVPCDGVGWNEVDLRGGEIRTVTSPVEYFEPEQVDTLNRLIDQHPIVAYVQRTGDQSTTKISDFVSAREFHRLELYTDFFRPLGVEDLLAFIIQAEPVIIGVAFTRGRRSYAQRDREVLNLLRPHLAAAYRNIREKLEARERAAALERGLDGREVVSLTPSGHLATRSPMLEQWFGATPPMLEPGVYDRHDARLTVRRVEGDQPLLLLDELRFAPDPQRVREFGLTRREADILMLAARGLSDARIADELYVSIRTVSKHLQHAYGKLGVHSRAEATRLLLGG